MRRHLFFMAAVAFTAISAWSAEYPEKVPKDFKQALRQFSCTRNWPEPLNIHGYHNPSDDWMVVVHSRPDHDFLISYIIWDGEEQILEIYLNRDNTWRKIGVPSDAEVNTSAEQYAIRQTLNYGADCVTLNFPVPQP